MAKKRRSWKLLGRARSEEAERQWRAEFQASPRATRRRKRFRRQQGLREGSATGIRRTTKFRNRSPMSGSMGCRRSCI